MLWYPITTGRLVAEPLRAVQALQTCDRLHTLTPEGWKAGDEPVGPRLRSVGVAEGTPDSAYGCVDWYCYVRPTPASYQADDPPRVLTKIFAGSGARADRLSGVLTKLQQLLN